MPVFFFSHEETSLLQAMSYQNSCCTAVCCVVEDVALIAQLRECSMLTVSPEMQS